MTGAVASGAVRAQPMSGDVIDNAVRANIALAQKQLGQQSSLLEQKVSTGVLKIVGAYTDLDTGALEMLG